MATEISSGQIGMTRINCRASTGRSSIYLTKELIMNNLNNLPISTTCAEQALNEFSEPYQCYHCDAVYPLDGFTELEHDGDLWGVCPNCNIPGFLRPVGDDEEELIK